MCPSPAENHLRARLGACRRTIFAVLLAMAAAASEATPLDWFGATFADYAVGQTLSARGTTGGAWQPVPSGLSVTNAFDGVRRGMSMSSEGEDGEVSFVPTASTGRDIERIDFSMCPESLGDGGVDGFVGAAGLTPALLPDGASGYYGYTADGWIPLVGEGVAPADGVWFDGRIELRTVDGFRMVSYLIKRGADWVRLTNLTGVDWFRTSAANSADGISSVSFTGNGSFSDFRGVEDDGDPLRLFRWVGGDAGDWDRTDNWSVGGVTPEAPPSADGDLAFVPGTVELTHGREQGTAKDLLVRFTSNAAEKLSGGLKTAVEVDVSRPRVGQALKVNVGTFLGMESSCSCSWRIGTMGRSSGTPAWGSVVSTARSYTPVAANYGKWMRVTVLDGNSAVPLLQKEFLLSRLPVFYMTTDDGAEPTVNKEAHAGSLFVQGNDEWKSPYDGAFTIKVRGNSTRYALKKPYKLKLDKKTKLFDLAEKKNKHWVLLANFYDMSQLRNKLASDFANDIGGTCGMNSTWVECVLNGDYLGTYLLCEHIRPAEDRCPVYDWEGAAGDLAEAFAAANGLTSEQEDELATQLEQNFDWVTSNVFTYYDQSNGVARVARPGEVWGDYSNDITGGYVFEFSQEYDELTKFKVYAGRLHMYCMLNAPEYLYTNSGMLRYCQDFLQNYFDACTSMIGYSNESRHWSEYCDVDSMVGFWLVNELYANNDSCKKSRYAYKDRGGKMFWGPVWDFDWGAASVVVPNAPEAWATVVSDETDGEIDKWSVCKEWAADPWFCTKLHERYWEIRAIYAHAAETGGLIDSSRAYLKEACEADDRRWAADGLRNSRTAAYDAEVLKNFLRRRLAWLDRQFASVPTLMASTRSVVQSSPYTADSTVLPMAFDNLLRSGAVYDNAPLRLSMPVVSSSAVRVDVFVNGLRVGTLPIQNRRIVMDIPAWALTAPKGKRNCVSLVAYTSSGEVRARNYALVTQVPARSVLIVR